MRFSKIAVSSGHEQFGLLFWQLVVGVVLMAGLSITRGTGLPLTRRAFAIFVLIALIGTIIPGSVWSGPWHCWGKAVPLYPGSAWPGAFGRVSGSAAARFTACV